MEAAKACGFWRVSANSCTHSGHINKEITMSVWGTKLSPVKCFIKGADLVAAVHDADVVLKKREAIFKKFMDQLVRKASPLCVIDDSNHRPKYHVSFLTRVIEIRLCVEFGTFGSGYFSSIRAYEYHEERGYSEVGKPIYFDEEGRYEPRDGGGDIHQLNDTGRSLIENSKGLEALLINLFL